jgi:hypothetical protein
VGLRSDFSGAEASMTFKDLLPLGFAVGVALPLMAACGSNAIATSPSPRPASSTTQPISSPTPVPQISAQGRFTWTSIASARPLCNEITRQVGQSWPLWLGIAFNGDAVTLSLAEGQGPPGPFDDAPAVFAGVRSGNIVSASRTQANLGGMSCPGDLAITPQLGGELTATLAGNAISGEYTEVYGTGIDQVTFAFSFHATVAE